MMVYSLSSSCLRFLLALCPNWVSGPSSQGSPALWERLGTQALLDLGLPCRLSQFVSCLHQFQSCLFPRKQAPIDKSAEASMLGQSDDRECPVDRSKPWLEVRVRCLKTPSRGPAALSAFRSSLWRNHTLTAGVPVGDGLLGLFPLC